MTPVISVIIPAYNHASFVGAAIESVLQQTFRDWELIAIDDGSSDETFKVLSSFSDSRIRIYKQENAGSHATINRGIELARGQYISILNSDDEYAPERFQKFLSIAKEQKPKLYLSAVALIDASGETFPADYGWNQMYQDILSYWDRTQSSIQTLLWGNYSISTSNFFFDRSLLDLIGKFGHYRYVLDWEFVLRVALHDEQAITFLRHDVLLRYRLHGNNTILGGAIRNHIEAAYVLRRAAKSLAARGEFIPPHAINRIHYLERFVRQKETRFKVEQLQKAEQYLAATLAHTKKLDGLLAEKSRHEHELNVLLVAKAIEHQKLSQELSEKNHALHEKSYALSEKNRALLEKTAAVRQLDQRLAAVYESTSWRLTAPWRWVGETIRHRLRGLRHRFVKDLRSSVFSPASSINNHAASKNLYGQWLDEEHLEIERLCKIEPELAGGSTSPKFSIVVPMHNTPPAMLQAMFDSVFTQIYPHWELCVCDDATTVQETLDLLDRLVRTSSYAEKIRLHKRVENGHIALATNDAINLATGDYIVLLDHDDELAPHALLRLAQEIAKDTSLDFIYSDEDKLDEKGNRCEPFFKPDWSPALLWSQNYVGHLMCIRHDLIKRLGGMKMGTQGSQDHDLVLRVTASTSRILHIPEVLYHWRLHEGSVTLRPDGKPYAHGAGKQAVARALTEKYPEQFLKVDDAPYLFAYEPRFRLPDPCLISIIIPTKDKVELLDPCIESIRTQSTWKNFEILILDNNSVEKETEQYLQSIVQADPRIRVIPAPISFNWSRLNNIGVSQAKGDVFIFLNNDTTVITPDWQERLAEYALLPDVGTVGAQLLYPDGSIQHAGVVVGLGLWADHVFKGQPPQHRVGPFVSSMLTRNVMANTGACLAISRVQFSAIGGFDEEFEICGSDVEISIRAHKMGLQNIYLATVRLTHFESKTRSSHVPENDFAQSERKYAPYRLRGDPFFNRNLDVMNVVPSIRHPDIAQSLSNR